MSFVNRGPAAKPPPRSRQQSNTKQQHPRAHGAQTPPSNTPATRSRPTNKEGQTRQQQKRTNTITRTNRRRRPPPPRHGLDTIQERPPPPTEPKPKRKRYRKTKVLRLWVLPALFLVSLGIAKVEHSIGKIIDLKDVKDVLQEQVLDPWGRLMEDLTTPFPRLPTLVLANVSFTPRFRCPEGQRRMMNVHNPQSHSIHRKKIPHIVHQQSHTRCLTMKVDRATIQWAFRKWSYYIHDEDSRNRLFDRYCGDITNQKCEFPLLRQIVSRCLAPPNNSTMRGKEYQRKYYFLKLELWKFLALWVFGGVYVDLGFLPKKFSTHTIQKDDDAYLLIDPKTGMLSTKMMAVSPRHPIMYYAAQYIMQNILMGELSSLMPASGRMRMARISNKIGSSVLSNAFRMFLGDQEQNGQVLVPGIVHGASNRTIRLVAGDGIDVGNGENGLVASIFSSEEEKEAEYQKLGFPVFPDDAEEDTTTALHNENKEEENSSACLNELYRLTVP